MTASCAHNSADVSGRTVCLGVGVASTASLGRSGIDRAIKNVSFRREVVGTRTDSSCGVAAILSLREPVKSENEHGECAAESHGLLWEDGRVDV